jgi:L-alanine-DL-glutamate epimerase-like enolase superfamily enzyme
MKTTRRKFIGTALTGGLAAALPGNPYYSSSRNQFVAADKPGYKILDEILKQPVFRKEFFPDPVIIESLELLRYKDSFLCRVRSKNGTEGISVGHSGQLRTLYPVFTNLLQPFFMNKDARELDLILEKVYIYQLNFRLNGMALGVPLATIEFAILDMMGRISGKPIGELIGKVTSPKVSVYQATEYREKSVKESMELITRDVNEYNARALKIKIGGLMFTTENMYAAGPKGRTEEIVPLVRKTFGDKMVLYADSNGFYNAEEAIRAGRLLEEYKYEFFEEPVPFDWYEETKQVADILNIPIAGGEQEYSLHGFRWLIANNGLQVVQPDLYYFGGMIRSMRVALMASAMGKKCTPHMTGGGLGFLYMIHFVSSLPNALPYHEFKGLKTDVVYECHSSQLKVEDGMLLVPTGPGSGVEIDPAFIARHQVVKS